MFKITLWHVAPQEQGGFKKKTKKKTDVLV